MTLICSSCQTPNDDAADACLTCGHSLVAAVGVGSVVAGRYEIKAQLGRGGMGVVYRAHDKLLDEAVAIKVLRPEVANDPEISRRFQSEIKLARRVSHKNVCRIHEYGEDRGLRYISMEMLEGVDLRQILRQQQRGLPLDEAFAVCLQTADGLQAIHEVGVIHRDLKTPNIMRDARGQVRLMDFGIAKEGGAAAPSATATGLVVGTPEYMSPEQARGEKIDLRTDIYALGILIFEVFTGRVPFKAETPLATILKHLQEPPPLDDPAAAGVPDGVKAVIRKALAKDPAERHQTVEDLAAQLRAAREGKPLLPTLTMPVTEPARPAVAAAPPPAAPATYVAPAPTAVHREPAPTALHRETPRPAPPPAPAPSAPRPTPGPAAHRTAPAPRRSSNLGLWIGGGVVVLLVLGVSAVVVVWNLMKPTPPGTVVSSVPTSVPGPDPTPIAEPTPVVPSTTLAPAPATTLPPETLAPATTVPVTRPPATSMAAATLPPATVPRTLPPATQPAVPAEVAQLMGGLDSSDAGARWRSAEALGNLGNDARSAVPALVQLLDDRQEEVRWRAAEALGKIGPAARGAVSALARTAGGSGLPATEAAKALGKIGPGAADAVPALAQQLRSSDVYLRREVAKSLARIGTGAAPAVGALTAALQDKDKVVRMESARALGRVGGSARGALPTLAAMATRDGDDLVRRAAAEAKDAIEKAP
jgi:eukaryotic-like serine/threonine-protein kinase